MNFEVISDVIGIEIIASGNSIRELPRLRRTYGKGRWRKLKGFATILFDNETICLAEVHWYEANGIGKRELKIKRILDPQEIH